MYEAPTKGDLDRNRSIVYSTLPTKWHVTRWRLTSQSSGTAGGHYPAFLLVKPSSVL